MRRPRWSDYVGQEPDLISAEMLEWTVSSVRTRSHRLNSGGLSRENHYQLLSCVMECIMRCKGQRTPKNIWGGLRDGTEHRNASS